MGSHPRQETHSLLPQTAPIAVESPTAKEYMTQFLHKKAISTKSAVVGEKGVVNIAKQNVHTMRIKDYDSF